MPLSGVISIIALRDLDLLVNVAHLKYVYPEMLRVSAKMHRTIFIDLVICLRDLHLMNLTFF